ncbi:LysM peptidoglycan-binding domain-containing protein [Candidatus Bathyarchaeota archaeon]|nr:LysM peptidoglycan-binding domain-containing protein [Candidatus Bathyarchaeota archaeon]
MGDTCAGLWANVYVCVGTVDGPTRTPTPTPTAPPGNGIATPTPTQPSMVDNCNKFDLTVRGEGCQDVADRNKISLADFFKWNTAIGSDCRSLLADVHVCVGVIGGSVPPTPTTTTLTTTTRPGNGVATPTPIQDGMVTNCDKFHKVVKGDTCWDIAADSRISQANFYKWNKAVGTDCGGLWAGYYVCISLI